MATLGSGMSVRKYAKLAALGAVGVALGAFALYALIAYGGRPTPTGGIDRTHAVLTWIAAFIPIAAIAAAHLAYAKILLDESKRAG
jgi:hypothetical protein